MVELAMSLETTVTGCSAAAQDMGGRSEVSILGDIISLKPLGALWLMCAMMK